jgi:ParB-like chromosome segregation protein Spo0J
MSRPIPLAAIVFDAGTQIRAAINEAVVAEYAELMQAGASFPPVILFHDGNAYYMADGFHRAMAGKRIGLTEIPADVTPGTKADALWFALGANKANGQRLTEADKAHACLVAFSAWPDKSARQVAEQVGCSSTYASRIRDEVQTSLQPVTRVVGADGRSYPASRVARESTKTTAERLLREGKSVADVRAETGIGRDAAAQIRRDIGSGPDMSRAAVAQRKQDVRDMAERGFTTRQISASIGLGEDRIAVIAKEAGIVIHADRVVGKSKRHDSDRIVGQMVIQLESMVADVDLVDIASLNPSRLGSWITAMKDAQKALGAFIRKLDQEQKNHGEAA